MKKNLFKHALVALDLSEASELILECIPQLKKFGTEKITLTTVVPIPYTDKKSEFNTDKHRRALKAYKSRLEEQGFEVWFEVQSGVHFYPPPKSLNRL